MSTEPSRLCNGLPRCPCLFFAMCIASGNETLVQEVISILNFNESNQFQRRVYMGDVYDLTEHFCSLNKNGKTNPFIDLLVKS